MLSNELHQKSRFMDRFCLLLFTAIVALIISGCSEDGPAVVPVAGTVTRNSQPVANLRLEFVPVEGRPSWGETDDQGKFKLSYSREMDGAKIGTHTVYVTYNSKPSTPQEELRWQTEGAPKKPAEAERIEAKYGKLGTSPLKVEITKRETNLELKLD